MQKKNSLCVKGVLKMDLEEIRLQAKSALEELISIAGLKRGQILVIGCSTSEVIGSIIGTAGSKEVAAVLMKSFREICDTYGIYLAIQCCEHLNRALIVESEVAEKYQLEIVSVVPVAHAGGSLGQRAMEEFCDPVVVETISAHAGLDIGATLIGMHLKHVAVPVRLQIRQIGQAILIAARTRPKFIGGSRAVYKKFDDR